MSAFRTTRRAARAIALVYLLRLLVAWIVVSPIARALSSVVARNHPRGDAILFEAGGLELIESLRLSSTVLASEIKGALLIGTVLGALSLIPAAALFAALAEKEPTGPAQWIRRGVELFPRFLLTFGARLFCQGVLLGAGAIALTRLARHFGSSWSEPRADLAGVTLGLVVLLPVCALGVYEDLVRGEMMKNAPLAVALRRAVQIARSRPLALAGPWLLIAACSITLPLLAAPLVGLLDVSQPGVSRLIGVTVVHQLVVLCLVVLRALWLAVVVDVGSAPSAERLAVDLEVAASGPVPAQIEAHDAAPEPRQ